MEPKQQTMNAGAVNPILPIFLIPLVFVAAVLIIVMKQSGTKPVEQTAQSQNQNASPFPSGSAMTGSDPQLTPKDTVPESQSFNRLNTLLDEKKKTVNSDTVSTNAGINEIPVPSPTKTNK